jgi:hypothetical protein
VKKADPWKTNNLIENKRNRKIPGSLHSPGSL